MLRSETWSVGDTWLPNWSEYLLPYKVVGLVLPRSNVASVSGCKNYTDQSERLSSVGIMGVAFTAILKPLQHHNTMVLRKFEDSNWALIMPRDSQSHGQPMYIFPVLAPCIIKEVDNPRLLSRNNLLTPELQGSFNSPCSVVKKCIKCGRVCVCCEVCDSECSAEPRGIFF